jgi:hypothetical protein
MITLIAVTLSVTIILFNKGTTKVTALNPAHLLENRSDLKFSTVKLEGRMRRVNRS